MKTRLNTAVASAILALFSWALTVVMLFVLAVPFRWLWNLAIAPMGPGRLDYWHAIGVLLVVFTLEIARQGVKLSATFDSM